MGGGYLPPPILSGGSDRDALGREPPGKHGRRARRPAQRIHVRAIFVGFARLPHPTRPCGRARGGRRAGSGSCWVRDFPFGHGASSTHSIDWDAGGADTGTMPRLRPIGSRAKCPSGLKPDPLRTASYLHRREPNRLWEAHRLSLPRSGSLCVSRYAGPYGPGPLSVWPGGGPADGYFLTAWCRRVRARIIRSTRRTC